MHGLQGHPQKTWTSDLVLPQAVQSTAHTLSPPATVLKKRSFRDKLFHGRRSPSPQAPDQNHETPQGVYWPREFLKEDFPGARILTFGYDTDVTKGYDPVNQGNILSHSRNLLGGLVHRRGGKAADRDLVFIAHSLGGILVKEALRRSESDTDKKVQKIFKSTTGVLFFGTPHRGSEHWASMATNLTLVIKTLLRVDINEANVRALLPQGPELEICRESFSQQWEVRGNSLTVRTFQEGKAVVGIRGFNERVRTTNHLSGISY